MYYLVLYYKPICNEFDGRSLLSEVTYILHICLIAVWPTFKVDALERVFNGLDPVEGKDAERVVGQIQSFDGRHGMQDFRAKLAQEVAPQVQPDQAGQVSE